LKDFDNECGGNKRQQGCTTARRDNFGITRRIRGAKKAPARKVAYDRNTST
jgi:hypothetical protein